MKESQDDLMEAMDVMLDTRTMCVKCGTFKLRRQMDEENGCCRDCQSYYAQTGKYPSNLRNVTGSGPV